MPRRLNAQEIADKRERILEAAREVFEQKGYAETTMSKIAEKAAMPVSSLYNYFDSKEDIFHCAGLQDEILNYRPEYDRKRQAILDVSLHLMGQNGYSAVTLEEIAAQIGMPKTSFYQFFNSKEELFSTLLTESPLQESAYELDTKHDDFLCKDGLRRIGQSYLDMGDLPERTAIFRMALHESADHPEAGRLFYSEGISKVCDTLAEYIKSSTLGCRLSHHELKLAAWTFLSTMWASNIMFKVINGAERDFSDKEILNMSIEVFSAWLEKQCGSD